jgi:hypothetical protein
MHAGWRGAYNMNLYSVYIIKTLVQCNSVLFYSPREVHKIIFSQVILVTLKNSKKRECNQTYNYFCICDCIFMRSMNLLCC